MRIPDVIYDNRWYIFAAIFLVFVYPIICPLVSTDRLYFNNLNTASWLILILILVALWDSGRRRKKKEQKRVLGEWASDKRTSLSKKFKRVSIDTLAWIVFLAALIVFFYWLVVFA